VGAKIPAFKLEEILSSRFPCEAQQHGKNRLPKGRRIPAPGHGSRRV